MKRVKLYQSDKNIEKELIDKYLYLCVEAIEKFSDSSDINEFLGVSFEGLHHALKTFNSNKHKNIEKYILKVIGTYLIDEKVNSLLTININNDIDNYILDYKSVNGLLPSNKEIAKVFGISVSNLLEIRKDKRITCYSLDNFTNSITSLKETQDVSLLFEEKENREEVQDIFRELSGDDREIINKTFDGKPNVEIASDYGVSPSTIATVKAKTFYKLRNSKPFIDLRKYL